MGRIDDTLDAEKHTDKAEKGEPLSESVAHQ